MNVNPFWLVDDEVPTELKTAYKEAARDQPTARATAAVVSALHRLVDDAGFHTALQQAVHEAHISGVSALQILQARASGIERQIEEAKAAKCGYSNFVATRLADIQPVLIQCLGETGRLHEQTALLQKRIIGFAKQREAAYENYKSAGLTVEQIEQIGISPTVEDLAEWKAELEQKLGRFQQLASFYRSSPDYDLTLL